MTNDANSVKNAHDIDFEIYVCRLCGSSVLEIENGLLECTGTHGVTHIEYARWRREASRVFGPIINHFFGRWQ